MALAMWGDSLTTQMLSDATGKLPIVNSGQNYFDGGYSGQDTPVIESNRSAVLWPWKYIQVFWTGTNSYLTADIPTSIAALQRMVATVPHGLFLVMSGLNDGNAASGQGPAGSRYVYVTAYNARLAALYPNNYLDIRKALVDYGISISDANSLAYDSPPSTYQPTDVHLNTAGRTFCANAIVTKLRAMGYLSADAMRTQVAAAGGN